MASRQQDLLQRLKPALCLLSGLLLSACLLSACAPTPALVADTPDVRVTLNYFDAVSAPCSLPLEEAFGHELTIVPPGYKPFFVRLTQDEAGWGWRNVNFGSRVTLGLDLAYSAVYYLTDEELVAADDQLDSVDQLLTDHVYIVVAHEHGGQWRKIARLYPDTQD